MPMTDDDSLSDNESNIQSIADNDCTIEEKQGAFFEQLPCQNKTVKCLTPSELKNVMDQILGNYSLCTNRVKKKINAILLSLNEMSINDGSKNGIFDEREGNNNDLVTLELINTVILKHRNSFLTCNNNFILDNLGDSDYLRRSKNQFRKHKRLRLMSHRDKAIKKAKRYHDISRFNASNFQVNNKKIMACKFCGSTEQGERLSSCKKRAKLQGISTEYMLGMSQSGLMNFVKKKKKSNITLCSNQPKHFHVVTSK